MKNNAPLPPETLADVIDSLLPLISDKKRERVFEFFKSTAPRGVREEIFKTKNALMFDGAFCEQLVVEVLLGNITLAAARKMLRTEKNFQSVLLFKKALNLDEVAASILTNVYASPAAPFYFDDEMKTALAEAKTLRPDALRAEQAAVAIDILKQKASFLPRITDETNAAFIEEISAKYSLSFKLKKNLLEVYCGNPYADAKTQFYENFSMLEKTGLAANICAALSARVMLSMIVLNDAISTAALAKAIKYRLLEEDLSALAARYLRSKTPPEIAATLEAVLKRFPFKEAKEENLGRAVRVMLEGTKEALLAAEKEAESGLKKRNVKN